MKYDKILPILAGMITAIVFGFSFLFTKEALVAIAPFDLLSFRFGTATLVLIFLRFMGIIKTNYKDKNLKVLFILALFQPVLYFIFEIMGLSRTTTSEAGIMMSLIPIIVTCLASVFLKEIPSKPQVLSIFLSLIGVFIVILMKDIYTSGSLLGILFLIGAVLCAATLNILSRKLSIEFKPVEITFFMMCTGAIFFNGFSFINHGIKGDLTNVFMLFGDTKVIIAILYLGVLSSVVAFFLTNYNLAKLEASRAAVFANLTTVISVIAGVFIRKESFTIYQFVGTCMILLGVWGTNYYGEKKEKLSSNRDVIIE
ncbi:DMT family transporter [Marinisporobacter balticus]|uniref:Drug/metabolite transporter (DMT)-like permease n=1 Tax=Marinisporobacter balticus TaxID=2018667 RepID=A0A4R2KP64_9FIRM|nr:DMT family transporter [Marinisporobacter balticus]TCO74532.1 drug/metabolite transporter (DMT)-like permease [Marinisporobacter balticus]